MKRRLYTSPAALASGYALLIFLLGLFVHPILAMGSECDDYVGMARGLLQGQLPHDVFHPLGYSVFTAGLTKLLGVDFFIAARLVSALAAGLLVWSTYHFTRIGFSPFCGAVAAATVALHREVVLRGVMAADTITATALCALTLLICIHTARSSSWRWPVVLGAAFGLAYWVRYSTLPLLVPAGIALCLPAALTNLGRAKRLVLFGAATAITLIPHFLLSHAQWGSILYDENWRTLACKYHGDYDANYVYSMPFDSWSSVFWHDPRGLIDAAISHLGRFFSEELPAFLTGRNWGPVFAPDWIFYALAMIGAVISIMFVGPTIAIGCAFAFCYLFALTVFYYTWDRLVLLAVPALIASSTVLFFLMQGASALCTRLTSGVGRELLEKLELPDRLPVQQWLRGFSRMEPWLRGTLALASVGYVASFTPQAVMDFANHHPHAEYAAIRKLVEEHGTETAIYSPYNSRLFRNHIVFRPVDGPFPVQPELDRAIYVKRLHDFALESDVDFMVFGRGLLGCEAVTGRRNFETLASGPFPAHMRIAVQTEDTLVLAVAHPELVVEPNPYSGGTIQLRIDPDIPAEEVQQLALKVITPDGKSHWLGPPAEAKTNSPFSISPVGPLPAGIWRLTPHVLTRRGLVLGQTVDWTVR